MPGRFTIWDVARAVGESPVARLATIGLWSLDPFGANFADIEPARRYHRTGHDAASPAPRALKVMTWNIKFGGGRIDFFYDGHGERVLMESHEVYNHLAGLAEKIREVDPDVLFLQEADIDSTRSARIDQVAWLLDHTDLAHGAYASQWRSSYIPSRNLGRVNAGIAILSKYPLERAQRIAMPLIEEHDGFTQYFFLRRCALRARISTEAGPLWVINAHTSAFTIGDSKRAQLLMLSQLMGEHHAAGEAVVCGGDWNVLPPGSPELRMFPDVKLHDDVFLAADYTGQSEWLLPFYKNYEPAISLSEYLDEPGAHTTHSVTQEVFWTRKLDYLFSNRPWRAGESVTHQDERSGIATMPLSDHAPVSGVISL